MTGVQIKASFKKDSKHLDGLNAVASQIIANPNDRIVVVAILEPVSIVRDLLSGTEVPRMGVRHIEVGHGETATALKGILSELYTDRTGREDTQMDLFDVLPDAGDGSEDAGEPWPGDVEFVEPDVAVEPDDRSKRRSKNK